MDVKIFINEFSNFNVQASKSILEKIARKHNITAKHPNYIFVMVPFAYLAHIALGYIDSFRKITKDAVPTPA
jgi:hypothetical protein